MQSSHNKLRFFHPSTCSKVLGSSVPVFLEDFRTLYGQEPSLQPHVQKKVERARKVREKKKGRVTRLSPPSP